MAWEKGQSGNPAGRPKDNNQVKYWARHHSKEAIERLAFWMRSDNPKASVASAEVLLDRAWGKASQQIDHEVTVGLSEVMLGIWRAIGKGHVNGTVIDALPNLAGSKEQEGIWSEEGEEETVDSPPVKVDAN